MSDPLQLARDAQIDNIMRLARECAHPQANAANWHGLRAALDAAIAQRGEPVARMHPDGRVINETSYRHGAESGGASWLSVMAYTIPLYTAPPSAAQRGKPVAWTTGIEWVQKQSEQVLKLTRKAQPEYGFTVPLYTAPPARAPLTDEQMRGLLSGKHYDAIHGTSFDMLEFARAIERAHGITGA